MFLPGLSFWVGAARSCRACRAVRSDYSGGMETPPAYLVHDGACPFCASFARLARLRACIGTVKILNAREEHPVVARLWAEGYDLDQGMAFVRAGQVFHGEAALQQIATLSSPVGPLNALNAVLLRDSGRARRLYPLLRALRDAALRWRGAGPLRAPAGSV